MVLDMVRDRLNLTQRGTKLMEMHRRWQPIEVRYEEYGLQADIQHIQTLQEQQNYRFDIVKVAGRTPKPDRIKRLVPLFEQSRVYLPPELNYTDYEGTVRDLVRDFVETEYKAFPVPLHDDMLDALSRIEEPGLELIWPKARPTQTAREVAQSHWSGGREQAWMS